MTIDESYVSIYGWMREKMDLKKLDLEVYALIYSFTRKYGCYKGSNQYIADYFGFDKRSVINSIKKLEESGHIEITRRNGSKSTIKALYFYNENEQEQNVSNCKVKKIYKKSIDNNQHKNATTIYNRFPQNNYDFEELEKEFVTN